MRGNHAVNYGHLAQPGRVKRILGVSRGVDVSQLVVHRAPLPLLFRVPIMGFRAVLKKGVKLDTQMSTSVQKRDKLVQTRQHWRVLSARRGVDVPELVIHRTPLPFLRERESERER